MISYMKLTKNPNVYIKPTVDIVKLEVCSGIMQMSGDPDAIIPPLTDSGIDIVY